MNNQNKTVCDLIAQSINPIKLGDFIGASIYRGGIRQKLHKVLGLGFEPEHGGYSAESVLEHLPLFGFAADHFDFCVAVLSHLR